MTASDAMEIAVAGGVEMGTDNDSSPDELLGCGHHFDGVGEAQRKQFARRGIDKDEAIPRDRLLLMVELGDCQRKVPKGWK